MESPVLRSQGMESPVHQSQGMESPVHQSQDTGSPELVSSGMESPELVSSGMVSPVHRFQGMESPELVSSGMVSQVHRSQGMESPVHKSRGMESPELVSSGMVSPGMESPAHKSQGMESPELVSSGMVSQVHRFQGMESPAHKSRGMESPELVSSGMVSQVHRSQGMESPVHKSQGMESPVLVSSGMESPVLRSQGKDRAMDEALYDEIVAKRLKKEKVTCAWISRIVREIFACQATSGATPDSQLLKRWIDLAVPLVDTGSGKHLMCVIPAGLTSYLRAGDIGIYNSFKDLLYLEINACEESGKVEYTRFGNPPAGFADSYLDWHTTRHDMYGEKFREKWEALTEGEQDEFDFNLDNLHDALDDIAQINE
ncbi:Proline rich antigen 2 [Phytophthora palmivora]|uniref:Proline rich antigen 2 n=1 Tax=Phytophthora palmivora TaxID=4796 RepID=A0A2P4YUZ1_9STRA|nr:Proline rich antigen 2 [Phytophthora palmivora]